MTRRKVVTVFGFIGWLTLAASATASATLTNAPDPERPAIAGEQGRPALPEFRDEAAMVLVGSALIGLAAAVRRAA